MHTAPHSPGEPDEERGQTSDSHEAHTRNLPVSSDPYLNTWQENRILHRTDKLGEILSNYQNIPPSLREKLQSLLPDSSLRPTLAAAIVYELKGSGVNPDTVTEEELIQSSPILQLTHQTYSPTYIQDVLSRLETMDDRNSLTMIDKLDVIVQEQGGINSTLRNMLIADRLNATIFRGTNLQAQIALAQYTWREQNAKISRFALPELPEGCADNKYVRLLIAVSCNHQPLTYFDYGQNEGSERYGITSTGEGLGNIVGTPPPHELFDTSSDRDVLSALRAVRDSQLHSGEREAVRRIGVHGEMVRQLFDFMETEEGRAFPAVISGVDSLSTPQLEFVLRWSRLVEKMTRGNIELVGQQEMRLGTGMVFTPFRGLHARVEATQPSTRTVTAAVDAMKALGMEVDVVTNSSRDKGESPQSEGVTLTTHAVDVVLRRDKNFEEEALLHEKLGDAVPTRISLGGNFHHPTQTIAEIRVFMEVFGCTTYTIEELRTKTAEQQAEFTFIGRTDQKRADKALIQFILEKLPECTVNVYVPEEKDLPEIQVPAGAKYSAQTHPDLLDQNALRELTKNTTLLYTSNAEATSKVEQKGSGDGKLPAPHYISTKLLEDNGMYIMHPLPASGELDDGVFGHRLSLIPNQMREKIHTMIALVAAQQAAKKKRMDVQE